MNEEKKREILEAKGWTIECESPLEIRHYDGSFATLNAAKIVVEDVLREWLDESREEYKNLPK